MRKQVWLLCMIGVMLAIFLFSAQSAETSGKLSDKVATTVKIKPVTVDKTPSATPVVLGFNIRKLAHIFMFAMLGFTCYGWLNRPLISIGVCYLYAVLDEVHQYFVPGRAGLFEDTLIDAIGFVLVIVSWWVIKKLRTRINKE